MALRAVEVCDPTLLSDIRRYGKFDTSGCYQCGSCTLSCDLAEDSVTFPRKSIRYALLGLRESLVRSLDPWICHDCGDCSLACPRQAEPRISMITLRRFLSARYEWTGLGARLLRSEAWYIGSLVLVAASTLLLILVYHLRYLNMGTRVFVTTPLGLEHMFPIMSYYTAAVVLVPFLLLLSRIVNVWRLALTGEERASIPLSAYLAESWIYVYQSVTHSGMRRCPDRNRWLGHWMMAFAVVLMLAIKVFALRWFQTDAIHAIYHPQRWIGYLAAIFILYGTGHILLGRLKAKKEIYKETRWQDLGFPVLIILTVLTGLLAHIFRYAGFGLTCHFLYAAHVIVATPMLLVEMSFGKWSHMVYRPLALYFLAVKKRSGWQEPVSEVVVDAV